MRASRGPYLWLFSVWIVSPAAIANGRPVDREIHVAQRLEMHLDPRAIVVPDRAVAERVDGDRAVQLAVDPREQVEVERRGHARASS